MLDRILTYLFIPVNCQSQTSQLTCGVCQNWNLELHFKALSSSKEIHVLTELKFMPRHLWSLTGSFKKPTQPTNRHLKKPKNNTKTQAKPPSFYKLQYLTSMHLQYIHKNHNRNYFCLFREHQCNNFCNSGKLFFSLTRSYVNLQIP